MVKQNRQSQTKEDIARRQQALNDISDEDLAKINAHKASTEGRLKVDDEWLLLTEFAMTFGWQAYLDVKHDNVENINMQEMLTLLEASRKIKAARLFDKSHASFIGNISAKAKNSGAQFKKMTKSIINSTKVDQQ